MQCELSGAASCLIHYVSLSLITDSNTIWSKPKALPDSTVLIAHIFSHVCTLHSFLSPHELYLHTTLIHVLSGKDEVNWLMQRKCSSKPALPFLSYRDRYPGLWPTTNGGHNLNTWRAVHTSNARINVPFKSRTLLNHWLEPLCHVCHQKPKSKGSTRRNLCSSRPFIRGGDYLVT